MSAEASAGRPSAAMPTLSKPNPFIAQSSPRTMHTIFSDSFEEKI
jgi:hypothetical protein